MTFARVSMILPLHCGHCVGRATVVVDCVTGIVLPLYPKAFAKSGVCRGRASAWAKLRPARWRGGRLKAAGTEPPNQPEHAGPDRFPGIGFVGLGKRNEAGQGDAPLPLSRSNALYRAVAEAAPYVPAVSSRAQYEVAVRRVGRESLSSKHRSTTTGRALFGDPLHSHRRQERKPAARATVARR